MASTGYSMKIDESAKAYIEEAAKRRGVSMAAFMTMAAMEKADEVMRDAPRVIDLDEAMRKVKEDLK